MFIEQFNDNKKPQLFSSIADLACPLVFILQWYFLLSFWHQSSRSGPWGTRGPYYLGPLVSLLNAMSVQWL